MVALLRVLAIVPIALAAKMRREERRLVDWYRARGAFDEQTAVTQQTRGAVAGFVHRRLEGAGAIRGTASRYYFDETRYAGFRTRRRRRAFVVITLLVVAIGIGFLTGVITP